MEIDNSAINKIKNLMNLTDHRGATENEASAAMGHAMRLLAKYNLDMAEFDKLANPVEEIGQETLSNEKRSMQKWKSKLLNAITEAHFCDYYYLMGYRSTKHVVVGKPTNVQAVKIVYAFLCDVIDTDCKNALTHYQGFEHGKSFCNSFRLGMASRIAERFRQEKKSIQEDHEEEVKALGEGSGYQPNTSIVVKNIYDEAQKEIKEYYNTIGIKFNRSYGYSGSNNSGAGYKSGYQAGANVPLHASPSLNQRN